MNPYAHYTFDEEGNNYPKIFSHGRSEYVNVCSGCNQPKRETEAIDVFGTLFFICEACTFDLTSIWDRPRTLLLEKYKEEKFDEDELNNLYVHDEFGYDDYYNDPGQYDDYPYADEDDFYL